MSEPKRFDPMGAETQEQKDERMALELFPDIPSKKNYRPEACHGVIALVIEVPPAERSNPANDIAEAYAVETGDDIPGGCIIWGKYRGEWVANASGRWLISRFLKTQ